MVTASGGSFVQSHIVLVLSMVLLLSPAASRAKSNQYASLTGFVLTNQELAAFPATASLCSAGSLPQFEAARRALQAGTLIAAENLLLGIAGECPAAVRLLALIAHRDHGGVDLIRLKSLVDSDPRAAAFVAWARRDYVKMALATRSAVNEPGQPPLTKFLEGLERETTNLGLGNEEYQAEAVNSGDPLSLGLAAVEYSAFDDFPLADTDCRRLGDVVENAAVLPKVVVLACERAALVTRDSAVEAHWRKYFLDSGDNRSEDCPEQLLFDEYDRSGRSSEAAALVPALSRKGCPRALADDWRVSIRSGAFQAASVLPKRQDISTELRELNGVALAALGRTVDARQAFRTCADSPRDVCSLGLVLLNLHSPPQSFVRLLGQQLITSGDWEALAASLYVRAEGPGWRRAVDLRDSLLSAQSTRELGLAVMLEQLSESRLSDTALQIAQRAESAGVHAPELAFRVAEAFAAAGKCDRALPFYRQAATDAPQYGTLKGWSVCLTTLGRTSEVEPFFPIIPRGESLWERVPDYVWASFWVGGWIGLAGLLVGLGARSALQRRKKGPPKPLHSPDRSSGAGE